MTRTHAIDLNKRILVSLSILLLCTILMYMGFVLTVVVDTAARADAERASGRLVASIAGLEARYIALSETLTQEEAARLGYVTPISVRQVTADPSVSTLTLRAAR